MENRVPHPEVAVYHFPELETDRITERPPGNHLILKSRKYVHHLDHILATFMYMESKRRKSSNRLSAKLRQWADGHELREQAKEDSHHAEAGPIKGVRRQELASSFPNVVPRFD